jgi:protein CpxP
MFLAVGTAIALALSAAVFSQTDARRHHRGHMGGESGMRLLRELDLTDAQREQIRTLFDELEATGASERVREARESLQQAIESGADEAELRSEAARLGEAEGDAAVERARVRTRVQEVLTPEQREELEHLKRQAKERRELMRRQREERRARRERQG